MRGDGPVGNKVTDQPYLLMRRWLREPSDLPSWPLDVRLKAFEPADCISGHVKAAHALLELAYSKGGGSVPSCEIWWSSLSRDAEYDPALCFPLFDADGRLVAFAQCWTTAFVKDFAVHPRYRRRGLGRALLLHVFHVFRERGAQAVDLKVETANVSGAIELYESLGMVRVDR